MLTFVKFLSPNDTGLTGSHQCGIYIPKTSIELVFDRPFEKGDNHERWVDIIWNDDQMTHSRFVYYGKGTRNEYRITNFGRGFRWLVPERTGDLVVVCKQSQELYHAFVLSTEEEIETYLNAFSISPTQLNRIIGRFDDVRRRGDETVRRYAERFGERFPSTVEMAEAAQMLDRELNGDTAAECPDETPVRWVDTEYRLFQCIEEHRYSFITETPMRSLDEFVGIGLEIANRRKSRAGRSLEHHLGAIFRACGVRYTPQALTEGNRRPDFLFPLDTSYHDPGCPDELLTFLGAKTTCKDRWRQVLNEAARISEKHLFTLQQGVSPMQLDEMHEEHVTLVVPHVYHRYYPRTPWTAVISLRDFIDLVLERQHRAYELGVVPFETGRLFDGDGASW